MNKPQRVKVRTMRYSTYFGLTLVITLLVITLLNAESSYPEGPIIRPELIKKSQIECT